MQPAAQTVPLTPACCRLAPKPVSDRALSAFQSLPAKPLRQQLLSLQLQAHARKAAPVRQTLLLFSLPDFPAQAPPLPCRPAATVALGHGCFRSGLVHGSQTRPLPPVSAVRPVRPVRRAALVALVPRVPESVPCSRSPCRPGDITGVRSGDKLPPGTGSHPKQGRTALNSLK